jgi:aryl-alcohol dehydrogenase-like predicted oxidoreductase
VSAGSAQVAIQAVASGAQVLEIAYNALYVEVFDAVREQCSDQGVGVLARSVLSYGLLTGHMEWGQDFREGDHRAERWTPQQVRSRIRQLEALRPVVGETIPTLRAVALRYALAQDQFGSVVLGPRRQVQLDQLVREAGREPPYLSPNQLRALEGRLRGVGAR